MEAPVGGLLEKPHGSPVGNHCSPVNNCFQRKKEVEGSNYANVQKHFPKSLADVRKEQISEKVKNAGSWVGV